MKIPIIINISLQFIYNVYIYLYITTHLANNNSQLVKDKIYKHLSICNRYHFGAILFTKILLFITITISNRDTSRLVRDNSFNRCAMPIITSYWHLFHFYHGPAEIIHRDIIIPFAALYK